MRLKEIDVEIQKILDEINEEMAIGSFVSGMSLLTKKINEERFKMIEDLTAEKERIIIRNKIIDDILN